MNNIRLESGKRRKIVPFFWLLLVPCVIFPLPASASPILVVEAIVAGVSAAGSTVGSVLALKDLVNWATLADDHPLYTDGDLGPMLTMSVMRNSFTFDLIQPLQIDYAVDDLPIRLKGTMKGDEGHGAFDAWTFDLTFTYEVHPNGPFGGTADTLTADGFFTHVTVGGDKYNKHEGEVIPASGLVALATITEDLKGPFPTTRVSEGKHDRNVHLNNDLSKPVHYDALTKVTLQAKQGEDDAFDRWQFTAFGEHKVPEPSTLLLLFVGLFFIFQLKRNKFRAW